MKLLKFIKRRAVRLLKDEGFVAFTEKDPRNKNKERIRIKGLPEEAKYIKIENESRYDGLRGIIKRMAAMFRPKEKIYEDPSDSVAKGGRVDDREEKLPDYYMSAIYPATKKPNIDRIKEWILKVKWRGLTDEHLFHEYTRNRELRDTRSASPVSRGITEKEKERLLDSTALMISRKIWYTGRRPATMTDSQWNEATATMRPAEGTYSGETWRNFPYTKDYLYVSGGNE